MFRVASGSVSLCVWNLLSPLSRHLAQYQCKHSTDEFQLKYVETRNSYAFYVSPTLFYTSAFVVAQEFTEYVCGAFVIDLTKMSQQLSHFKLYLGYWVDISVILMVAAISNFVWAPVQWSLWVANQILPYGTRLRSEFIFFVAIYFTESIWMFYRDSMLKGNT